MAAGSPAWRLHCRLVQGILLPAQAKILGSLGLSPAWTVRGVGRPRPRLWGTAGPWWGPELEYWGQLRHRKT